MVNFDKVKPKQTIMKKAFLILAFTCFYFVLGAQETQLASDTSTYAYCELTCMPKGIGKVSAYVDFGGNQKYIIDPVYEFLIMKDGKFATVESMLSILNFMASKGWQYVDSFNRSLMGSQGETYLLRKKQ